METKDPLEGQIANLNFLEQVYQEVQAHSAEVDPSWPKFFEGIDQEKPISKIEPSDTSHAERIAHLADAYRKYGHRMATINPIALEPPVEPPELNIINLGFQSTELQDQFPTLGLLPQQEASLLTIEQALKKRYCQTIGFEFKEVTEPEVEQWMQEQIESGSFVHSFSVEEKKIIYTLLAHAEILESFLHTKHVGKKRFSLEGSESLIPMLALLIAKGAEEGVQEIYIGMSHRGRLNVLANILDKPIQMILKDFDDEYEPSPREGMGDIRYHKGHANESVSTHHGKTVKISMASNPSHLESINPVVEGQVHARQFLVEDETERVRVIPLLMHGDAALSGQGIVYETLQMSKLPGFETGGTLHIVINNQIGFTTSPQEGRSTFYCTDIAHTFSAPVIHINAEDPETCVCAALMALELRQRFHCDVFLDFNCYRKYGHNEGDEPAFTQPLEYDDIRKKKSIRSLYLERLIAEGVLDTKRADEIEESYRLRLLEAFTATQQAQKGHGEAPVHEKPKSIPTVSTGVSLDRIKKVSEKFVQVPADFHIHPKLAHLLRERVKAIEENKPVDWGTAEYLTYGTLCVQGIPVRLAGQDSGRGTFSHRHALLVDQKDSHAYYPLAHLSENQARFEVLNTCLSEAAALGFEYGYSTICTEGLTIWEAQYGDFVNSAQVIIDQYIASGEQKWGQTSRLVLLLPHGFEGQGPEHSSARFERFLSLTGNDNMQIAYPTLPAQLFHLLRRQVLQSARKPLIVFTPKALLRHSACVSAVDELIVGHFRPVLDDPRKPQNVKKLILCSGRIYYDLDTYRQNEKKADTAIIRLEQLYPLPGEALTSVIGNYTDIQECLWVQEEPQNMGAWPYISANLSKHFLSSCTIKYVGRESSASPATGFYARHKQELATILNEAFKS